MRVCTVNYKMVSKMYLLYLFHANICDIMFDARLNNEPRTLVKILKKMFII